MHVLSSGGPAHTRLCGPALLSTHGWGLTISLYRFSQPLLSTGRIKWGKAFDPSGREG